MSESVTLKSYFYEVLIPSSQKNTSSPIEDILHHVSKYIFYEKACALQMFQSTHPHGVRPTDHDILRNLLLVSIHAPTRGATEINLAHIYLSFCFNPRIHTGCDITELSEAVEADRFQSTHPHGVRHRDRKDKDRQASFNPRTHTGCDYHIIRSPLICV